MGFFDRFKKQKKEENQEENKMGQELSASEKLSADLQKQINVLYKERNDAYQEQMNGWHTIEQEIQGQLATKSDLDTTKNLQIETSTADNTTTYSFKQNNRILQNIKVVNPVVKNNTLYL